MKNCVFTELTIVSFNEQRGIRISLHPRVNVFVGPNTTGKSALLKCLYWAFGAEPSARSTRWDTAEVAVLVKFEIDGTPFQMLRQRNDYVLASGAGEMIVSTGSVTSVLAQHIARIFDFGLVATDAEGKEFTPPPAFLFLPFYIDQEASWKNNWAGFRHLNQVKNYRRIVAEYHSGLRPNAYYRLKGELDRQQMDLKRLVAEQKVVARTKRGMDDAFPYQAFDLDTSAFAEDTGELLAEADRLAIKEREYSVQMQDLRSELRTAQLQSKAVANELASLKLDYRYATSKDLLQGVDCPTCGVHHQNTFLDRFELARDADRLEDLARALQEDITKINDQIAKTEALYNAAVSERDGLERSLAEVRGALTMRDLIASEGRKQVQQVFRDQLDAYANQIATGDARAASLGREIKGLENRKRREAIQQTYRGTMAHYLDELNVKTLEAGSYRDLNSAINTGGSELPRALLAYYYASLLTIRRFGSATFCPIVIDSPNQQGQDHDNLPAMINFVFDEQPENSQLILACEELHGAEPDGLVLRVESPLHALKEEEYESTASVVRPLLRDSYTLGL